MPYVTKAVNAMGGEYIESFSGSTSPHIWLSGSILGVGTIWYTAHPLPGTPNCVIIPFQLGTNTTFGGSLNATNVAGSIGVIATVNCYYKILGLN